MSFNHTSSGMENELSPFSFTDLNQMPMESKSQIPYVISSWIDLDGIHAPTIQGDLQELLGDHGFQLETTDASSFLPQNHNEDESFLLDLCDFNTLADSDTNCPILPELSAIVAPSTAQKDAIEEDETDRFLNDDLYLITQAESLDSCADQLHTQMSTATTTGTAAEDLCPQNSKARKEVPGNQEEEEEEVETDDDPKPGTLNCKNLVSERNRRKRLSQQLLALRALVPNITKVFHNQNVSIKQHYALLLHNKLTVDM